MLLPNLGIALVPSPFRRCKVSKVSNINEEMENARDGMWPREMSVGKCPSTVGKCPRWEISWMGSVRIPILIIYE